MRLEGLWREPDFLKLWVGQGISQAGSTISQIALPLLAINVLHASAFQMGLLGGVNAAAILIFGLFAGAWADRVRRRPIMILADIGRLVLLGTIPFAALYYRVTMGHLYAVAFTSSILNVLFDVSYQAYLPSLVERENILECNSKLALTESIAGIAGPGFTGVLVQLITAPMAILFDAASFLCSAASIALIRKPEPEPERNAQPDIRKEILEGIRAAWRQPILRALAKRTCAAWFFGGFFASLYFLFAIRELHLSTSVVGLIISVGGATSLLGAFAAERLVRRFGLGPTMIGSAFMTGIAMLLPALARGPVAVCVLMLSLAQVFDIAFPIYSINELSLRQAITPDELLGRVNSAMHMLFHGVLPIGALAGGVLAEAIGIRTTLIVGSIGFLLSTLWLVFSPVRHLKQLPKAAQAAAGTT